MPRVCTVCAHPEREAIDKALLAGVSCLSLAARYNTLGRMALLRHKAHHLPTAMVQAQGAAEAAHAENLLEQLKNLQTISMDTLKQAQDGKDLRVVASLIGQARGNLELLFKLTGELAQEGTVNILVLPEWARIRMAMLQALEPYPTARLAVAEALDTLQRADHDRR